MECSCPCVDSSLTRGPGDGHAGRRVFTFGRPRRGSVSDPRRPGASRWWRRRRARELDGGMQNVRVGVGPVTFDDVLAVTRGGAGVELTEESLVAIDRARAVVDELAAAPTPAYGISTGLGALATRHIPTELRER